MPRYSVIILLLFALQASAQPVGFRLADAGGYLWTDSDEPEGPAFLWIDISSSGTPVAGLKDDNVVGPFSTGFDFYFYGQLKNQFWINSDGCISFREQHLQFANDTIPTNSPATDFIAWFWDDLTAADSSTNVHYQSFGDSVLVVQFNSYRQYLQQNAALTAQVILRPQGEITINYLQVEEGFITDSETIGLQSCDSTIGTQVAHNQAYVHDSLALLFYVDENILTGMEPQEEDDLFPVINIFPNPFSANLSLQLDRINHFDFIISIFNSRGVLLTKRGIHCDSGSRNIDVPTSGLPPGTYFIRIQDSKGTQVVERIVKI